MSIFDTPDGIKALKKVGLALWMNVLKETATVTMIEWLGERHGDLLIYRICGKPGVWWEIEGMGGARHAVADTLDEALVAAVLATPAPEVRTEGEKDAQVSGH